MNNKLKVVINESASYIYYNDLSMHYSNQMTEGLSIVHLNTLLSKTDIDRLNNLKVIEIVSYKNLQENSYFTFKPKQFFDIAKLAVLMSEFIMYKAEPKLEIS